MKFLIAGRTTVGGGLRGHDGRLGNQSADTMEISALFVSILLTLACNTRSVSSRGEETYELCMRVGVGGPRGFWW